LKQLRTEQGIPNQQERLVINIMGSMVSKAAEQSRRQRHYTFCDTMALMRCSWM